MNRRQQKAMFAKLKAYRYLKDFGLYRKGTIIRQELLTKSDMPAVKQLVKKRVLGKTKAPTSNIIYREQASQIVRRFMRQ